MEDWQQFSRRNCLSQAVAAGAVGPRPIRGGCWRRECAPHATFGPAVER